MADTNPFKIKENAVKDRQISGFNTHRSTGDNLLFMPIFSSWMGKSLKLKQLNFFYLILFLLFFILFSRVIYLQAVSGSKYFSVAEENRLKQVSLNAPRGIIFDRFNRPLVKNVPRFALYLNPNLIQNDEQAKLISEYLLSKLPEHRHIFEQFISNFRDMHQKLFIADLDYNSSIQLMIKSSEFGALEVAYEPKREYLYSDITSHIIGYVGRISELEYAKNSIF